MRELVGQTLGDYQILRIVGHGSMGVVYEARHASLGRRVALKVLPGGITTSERTIRRFLREAQAVAQLNHDHVVPIYDVGHDGTTHYYAMQFLDGEPLEKSVRRGPLDAKESASIVRVVAEAIHFAHEQGIVHRDIKPANILRSANGRVVITDFGLAKPEQSASLTDSGAMVGTPLYMSPEQVRAQPVDRRTDVYSLGATLYELLTGGAPFPGTATQEILQKILDEDPPAPSQRLRGVPAELDVIVLKALEKEPRRRYSTAGSLADDLARYLDGEPIRARRTSIVARAVKRVQKHRTLSIVSAVAIAVSLLLFIVLAHTSSNRRSSAFLADLQAARSAYESELFPDATEHALAALEKRPGSNEAVLEYARALCRTAQILSKRSMRGDSRAQQQFEAYQRAFPTILRRLQRALGDTPEEPVAFALRGQLRLLLGGPEESANAIRDLELAAEQGRDEWETRFELARLRQSLSKDQTVPSRQRLSLTPQGREDATRAINLLEAEQRSESVSEQRRRTSLARLYLLRAETYEQLFLQTTSEAYLGFCRDDLIEARTLDQRLQLRADTLERWVDQRLADTARETPASLLGVGLEVVRVFVGPESDVSRSLRELYESGLDTVSDGWSATEGMRSALLEAMWPFADPVTTDAERADLLAEARSALERYQTDGDCTELDRAVEQLEATIESGDEESEYHHLLSVIYQSLDRSADSFRHAQSAARITPSDPVYLSQYTSAARQIGDLDVALTQARRAVAIAPNSVQLLALLAAVHLDLADRAGDLTEDPGDHRQRAEQLVAQIEARDPEDSDAAALRDRLDDNTPDAD